MSAVFHSEAFRSCPCVVVVVVVAVVAAVVGVLNVRKSKPRVETEITNRHAIVD